MKFPHKYNKINSLYTLQRKYNYVLSQTVGSEIPQVESTTTTSLCLDGVATRRRRHIPYSTYPFHETKVRC